MGIVRWDMSAAAISWLGFAIIIGLAVAAALLGDE